MTPGMHRLLGGAAVTPSTVRRATTSPLYTRSVPRPTVLLALITPQRRTAPSVCLHRSSVRQRRSTAVSMLMKPFRVVFVSVFPTFNNQRSALVPSPISCTLSANNGVKDYKTELQRFSSPLN